MGMKNFWEMVTQDKKEQERAVAARQIAIGVGAVVIAAAAGVATGILIAPKSGKETWDDLKKIRKCCASHECCCTEAGNDSAEECGSSAIEKE